MDDMTPTDKLRALLDERGVKWKDDSPVPSMKPWKTSFTSFTGEEVTISAYDKPKWLMGTMVFHTPEQAIAATVGTDPWEPSKEWKAWHESLKHDNPTSIREAVENILYEAIDFGGDMGPNGNVWSGVDEGTVLTENCINGWVKSIEEIAATVGVGTCHLEECEHEREIPNDIPECDGGWYTEVTYDCDECGYENTDPNINFCGGCGRKVVTE